MNKAYRIVWSAARQAWVVASERAGSGGRPPLAVKNAAGAMLLLAGLTSMSAEAQNYTGAISGPGVTQSLVSGDTSNGMSVSNYAEQLIYNGAIATSTNVTSRGKQTVFAGGSAGSTTLSGNAYQYVQSGGMASNTTVNNQGNQYVYTGGSIVTTTLNSGGFLTLNPNTSASIITINSGGRANIGGATADLVLLTSGGYLSANVGAQVTGINQLAGGSLNGDTSTTLSGINRLGSFNVTGGVAQNLLLENDALFFVLSGNSANNTIVGSGGYLGVRNEGNSFSTTVLSGGRQLIYAGGQAHNAIVNSGGTQTVNSGGLAALTVVDGGQELVDGLTIGTIVNHNGQQKVNVGGVASSTLVNSSGTQYVYGSAISTVVYAGGTQYVQSGGIADATQVEGGNQFVSAGGSATNSVVNSGGQLNAYGSVTSATLNDEGRMFVYSGASAHSTLVNSGGAEIVASGGLSTAATVNSSGYQTIYAGSEAVSATVSGGMQQVLDSATATSTILTSGGVQYISSGGTANGTVINNHTAQGVGGTANSASVAAGGSQYVYAGGSANWTTVTNNGFMNVQSGGSASGAIIEAGGALYANEGSIATDIVQAAGATLKTRTNTTLSGTNALGAFSISGGKAKNLLLENNGYLNVASGDSSIATVVNQGGWESVSGSATGTTVNSNGVQTVDVGGITANTVINAGGSQYVAGTALATSVNSGGQLAIFDGGVANQALINQGGLLTVNSGGTASDTTVAAGGLLDIADGGVLTLVNNNFVNDGVTTYDTSTNASLNSIVTGSGQLNKNGIGTLTLSGRFSQAQVNLNAGSLVMDGLDATTNIIAQSGTNLSLVNSTTLTGIIDPTDVTIDQSSTWNITGDSLVDNLTNAGSIVFAAPVGAFTPHTLTVANLAGNGGTITLNTIAGDSSSPIDKVIIDGGQATGSTGLRVLNRGGLGALTTGNGIAVIQAVNGATTEASAFNLNQPLVAGAYSYSLYRNADQSWYLTSQQTQPADPDEGTAPGTTPGNGAVNYRDGMWSYAALPSLSLDYDRLIAGSADTRFNYAADSRIWGRIEAGHLHHSDSGNLTGGSVPESSSAYSFVQLGGDLWQLDGANADWQAGVYGGIGLMRSDVWRDGGSNAAGTDRDTVYTGGAYLSGQSHSGLRVDGLLQASHHSLSVASNDNTRLSTDGIGWLASAEIGQAFNVTNALSLEPQLQYTIQGLNLDDGEDQAASISWSDSRRQSVRAGLKLSTPLDGKQKVSWWVTPSVTQTYGGHSGVTASVAGVSGSEASFRSKFSGTGVGVNGGIDAQIRENVTLGVQSGWSEALHGSESGGYYGMVRLGVSFR